MSVAQAQQLNDMKKMVGKLRTRIKQNVERQFNNSLPMANARMYQSEENVQQLQQQVSSGSGAPSSSRYKIQNSRMQLMAGGTSLAANTSYNEETGQLDFQQKQEKMQTHYTAEQTGVQSQETDPSII